MILNKECWWLADTSTIHTSKYNKNALNVTFCKQICSRNIENNYEYYKNTIYEAYDIREADESSNSFRPNSSSVHPNLT